MRAVPTAAWPDGLVAHLTKIDDNTELSLKINQVPAHQKGTSLYLDGDIQFILFFLLEFYSRGIKRVRRKFIGNDLDFVVQSMIQLVLFDGKFMVINEFSAVISGFKL